MRALLYGAGAVGLGVVSMLIEAGVEVDIIARKETKLSLKRNGLKITGIFGEADIEPGRFRVYENLCETDRDYDYTLIAIKSFDSEVAAVDIDKNTPEKKGTLVLMQNGWGNYEVFSRYFENDRIYSARIITGFSRPDRHIVDITAHADDIKIGSLSGAGVDRVEKLAEAISMGGLPTVAKEGIDMDIWGKMLYNCALNPLGAIFRVRYGKLSDSEYGRELIRGVVEEVFRVMETCGYSTYWENPKDYLEELYSKTMPLTAKHESSMLQDIRAQRRTEIDALNGQIVELGEANGIDVTVNKMVVNMVKFAEQISKST